MLPLVFASSTAAVDLTSKQKSSSTFQPATQSQHVAQILLCCISARFAILKRDDLTWTNTDVLKISIFLFFSQDQVKSGAREEK